MLRTAIKIQKQEIYDVASYCIACNCKNLETGELR